MSIVLLIIVLSILGFMALNRQYHTCLLITIAFLGAVALNIILKGFFGRPRPEVVPHLLEISSLSFPSGHSLLSMVTYVTIGALLARLANSLRNKIYILFTALTISFLVGVSRILLGVHYPTDVLAGWTVGLAWAITCWIAVRALQQRGLLK